MTKAEGLIFITICNNMYSPHGLNTKVYVAATNRTTEHINITPLHAERV